MCFGRKHCQKNCKLRDNNYCGGFALNAVLVELGQPDDPMAVYNKIQEYQKENILEVTPDSIASQYLLKNQLNGTKMSLPSGICTVLKEYTTGRTVTVYYTTDFGTNSIFKALIGEESGRIKTLGIHVDVFDGDLSTKDLSYVLVLVNDRHWIAVKRVQVDDVNKFVCYDPADGTEMEGDKMEIALKKSGYTIDKVNGLYICIV